jgi:hypothetical protein
MAAAYARSEADRKVRVSPRIALPLPELLLKAALSANLNKMRRGACR